jgi:uncharacterized tellurite resistance protein B-like protein
MLSTLRKFLNQTLTPLMDQDSSADHEHALRLATAVLMVEVMRADFDAVEEERDAIIAALGLQLRLTDEESRQLLSLAEDEMDAAISLHEYISMLNKKLAYEEKTSLIGLLWRVAYADERLDKYEEHAIRRIANLLHISHSDFIRKKLEVLDEVGKG